MFPTRQVFAFGLLVVASTAAQAGSPAAAPALASLESPLPKLELGLSEADYTPAAGPASIASHAVDAQVPDAVRSRSLAQYLKTPAPYDQLLPEPIEDHGVGFRVWF